MTDEKVFMVKNEAVCLASLPIEDLIQSVDEFTIKYRRVTLDEMTIIFPNAKIIFRWELV